MVNDIGLTVFLQPRSIVGAAFPITAILQSPRDVKQTVTIIPPLSTKKSVKFFECNFFHRHSGK